MWGAAQGRRKGSAPAARLQIRGTHLLGRRLPSAGRVAGLFSFALARSPAPARWAGWYRGRGRAGAGAGLPQRSLSSWHSLGWPEARRAEPQQGASRPQTARPARPRVLPSSLPSTQGERRQGARPRFSSYLGLFLREPRRRGSSSSPSSPSSSLAPAGPLLLERRRRRKPRRRRRQRLLEHARVQPGVRRSSRPGLYLFRRRRRSGTWGPGTAAAAAAGAAAAKRPEAQPERAMRVHTDLACLADSTGLPGDRGAGAAMLDASESTDHSRQLLLQLNAQRTKGFLCDVILVVQNALFRAHKNVLAASSAYLKALVVHDNLINLDQEMVSPGVFRAVLDFIYTGRLGSEAESGGGGSDGGGEPSLGAVLAAASYLQIPDLVALCKKKLRRSGKFCQLRGGYSPFGKLARGIRAATPVIQSCYAAGPPRPVEPGNPLSTHCGELYAAASQGAALHPHGGLCPPERLCSPLCGLDLSKKSPNGPSPHLPPPPPPESRLRAAVEGRENSLPPLPESPTSVVGAALLSNHAAFGEAASSQLQASFLHHHHHHHHRSSSSPGPEPSGRAEVAPEFLYRWMKHEPSVGGYLEDDDDDDDEEEEEGDCRGGRRNKGVREGELGHKAESPPSQQRRYPTLESGEPDGEAEDLENDKSTSEETGCSSGGPSPAAGSLERYLGYEPESFGGDNLYVCIPCGKGFPSSEQLNAHVEAHNEEEELYRKEAAEAAAATGQGSPFLDKQLPPPSLQQQQQPSQPPSGGPAGCDLLRPYRCSSCDKAYKDPATLRQHEKTHWLTRPYPCSICGKKFTQRGTMTRHMRSHLGLKPFACDACGMRFTRQYRLTEHMRIHSGEKPYECQVCGGKFAQQRNLLSHMKMHAAAAAAAAAAASTGPDGKLKLDVLAMARLAQQQQQQDKELLSHASHFLAAAADPKAAMESLYLGLSPDKAAEVMAQGVAAAAAAAAAAHLHNDHQARTIDRFSPP
ncbi:hypermethylated in cancer 1 protein [Rhineura floridana]|uniref:hypermethylated in cancer 1 protein n=1 Tax=Rhineura floridana TaxID=261503 RepID=UPI002AC80A7A|nr:hypermethylated in cancer 1 protein [Rhineura floridana]